MIEIKIPKFCELEDIKEEKREEDIKEEKSKEDIKDDITKDITKNKEEEKWRLN